MKRNLLIGFLSLVALGNAAKDYKIVGRCLDSNAKGKVSLVAYNENNRLDTIGKSTISHGQFLMTGSVAERTYWMRDDSKWCWTGISFSP